MWAMWHFSSQHFSSHSLNVIENQDMQTHICNSLHLRKLAAWSLNMFTRRLIIETLATVGESAGVWSFSNHKQCARRRWPSIRDGAERSKLVSLLQWWLNGKPIEEDANEALLKSLQHWVNWSKRLDGKKKENRSAHSEKGTPPRIVHFIRRESARGQSISLSKNGSRWQWAYRRWRNPASLYISM